MVRLKVKSTQCMGKRRKNFNSTMVRLKGKDGTIIENNSIFQFHYGTIKSICRLKLTTTVVYFNSTMVRLKVLTTIAGSTALAGFQFHYGTIKRFWFARWPLAVRLFQFHYGTIKRKWRLQPKRLICYFNSTMVRLKVRCVILIWQIKVISIPLWYD